MKERYPKPGSEAEMAHRETISLALENEAFWHYAAGDGPLGIIELPRDLRNSEGFQEFVHEFGWPTGLEDGDIWPVYPYNTDTDFREAFLSHAKPGALESLNNFRHIVKQEPNILSVTEVLGSGLAYDRIYGSLPALHRLNVVMPEEARAVRELLGMMEQKHDGDFQAFDEELSIGVNEELVSLLHRIYRIMGRLVKADDLQRQQRILYPGGLPYNVEPAPLISNAHDALRT